MTKRAAELAAVPPSTRGNTPLPQLPSVHQHLHRPRLSLHSVAAVCSQRALPHALRSVIGAFVTDDHWTIDKACKLGNLDLLQRVTAHEEENVHPLYCKHAFEGALELAVKHENAIELLECLSLFCPTGFSGKGMAEAARLGNVTVMDWFASTHRNVLWSSKYADEAAIRGHLDVLKWLKKNDPDADEHLTSAIPQVARSGNCEIVKWLYENVPAGAISGQIKADAFYNAIDTGDLAMARFFHTLERKHIAWIPFHMMSPIELAANSGNLEIIKWLHALGYIEFNDHEAVADAPGRGFTDIVSWLIENNPEDPTTYDRAFLEAVKNGSLGTAKLLHCYHSPEDCYMHALGSAADNGHTEVVKWVYKNLRAGCTSRQAALEHAIRRAAQGGHFKIVKWLHARLPQGRRPRYDFTEAAANGHFEIVKWLVANSDRIDDRNEIDGAAESGNLEMVTWLHENTNPGGSESAMESAAEYNHFHVLKWLHENRSADGCSTFAMDIAARNNNLEIVKWLHENRTEGCTTDAMDQALSVEMTEWLHVNRIEGCTRQAMSNAAVQGDVDTLLFLHVYRSEGCTMGAALSALSEGHVAIFEWLVESYPDVMKLDELFVKIEELNSDFLPPLFAEMKTVKRQRLA